VSFCLNRETLLSSGLLVAGFPVESMLLISIKFPSSGNSGTIVSDVTGTGVVDLLLVKIPFIRSFSFLVLSLGVVRGVLTVVDLAKLGLLGKKDPGRLEGKNNDLLVEDDSVVV